MDKMDKSPHCCNAQRHNVNAYDWKNMNRRQTTQWLSLLLLAVSCQASAVWQQTIHVGEPASVAAVPAPAMPVQHASDVPDFSQIHDVAAKKQAFFEFMLPMIREANEKIRSDRNEILSMRYQLDNGYELGGGDHQRLKKLMAQYRLPVPEIMQYGDLTALLERVDVVPASLVLAQSANESGWGTSRFAVEANNFFGIWCFTEGCGVVPKHRSSGLKHEVAKYDTVFDGVEAYMRTINTHRAYDGLRAIRAEQRAIADRLLGMELAEGLLAYSERGEDYVREIQAMIRVNNLEAFTRESSV